MRSFLVARCVAFLALILALLTPRAAQAQDQQCLASGFLPGSAYGTVAITLPQSVINQWAGPLGLLRPLNTYEPSDIYRQRGKPVGRLDVRLDNGCMQLCTATLLPDGHIITAGHCFAPRGVRARPADARVIFDHDDPHDLFSDVDMFEVDLNSVHILDSTEVDGEAQIVDIAIARLERTPAARAPALLMETIPEQKASLYMISHPLGLPRRIALTDCRAEEVSNFRLFHACDTLAGSSGAAFLDTATHRILGIHTDGISGVGGNNYGWLIAGFSDQIRARYGESLFEPAPLATTGKTLLPDDELGRAIAMFEARDWGTAAPIFARLAAKGEATAQAYLGRMTLLGLGTTRNERAAIDLLRASAAQGSPVGQNALADCYRHGIGMLENPDEARRLYHLAAEAGYAPAQYELGRFYNEAHTSGSDAQDERKMLRWWRAAAEQDYIPALNAMSFVTGFRAASSSDEAERKRLYAEALTYDRRAGALGDAQALASLGSAYREGRGVMPDTGAALAYYTRAAELGYVFARALMGDIYLQLGGNANYAEARRLFEATADSHFSAERLGMIYFRGLGTAPDYQRASDYYLRAIRDSGQLPETYANLAVTFRKGGQGLARDRVAAFQWTLVAAEIAAFLDPDSLQSLLAVADRDWRRLSKPQRRAAVAKVCTFSQLYTGVPPLAVFVNCPDQPAAAPAPRYVP